MNMRCAVRCALAPVRPLGRKAAPTPWTVRPFSSAAKQAKGGAKEPMRKPSTAGAQAVYVPEVTPEQTAAMAALRKAEHNAAAAGRAAGEAASLAKALKKVAEEYVAKKDNAEREVIVLKQSVDDALAAKTKADERAVGILETAANQDKAFLKKAFQSFDTDNDGKISPNELRAVLTDLKLPSNNEDVEDLVQCLDIKGWVAHATAELKNALKEHPHAKEWGA